MKFGISFCLGILVAGALSAFFRNVSPFEAIGLACVIAGTTLFIFLLLTLATFGAYVLWRVQQEGLESLKIAFHESNIMPEKQR